MENGLSPIMEEESANLLSMKKPASCLCSVVVYSRHFIFPSLTNSRINSPNNVLAQANQGRV